mmetsp:Transcript_29833/g.70942  ORF Transcript_29833/g.70942 Transcript_29833/m.70942 type:complete len:227 (+) Transcript_29833:193-873(+)
MMLPLGLAATLALSLGPGAHGFASRPRVAGSRTWRVNASPTDFLSGITGIAPSSLTPPSELLEGTSIDPTRDDVKLERVYKASKDGWSAIDFHGKVDGKGSALVVVLNKSGQRFGGFNPSGWTSTDDYYSSNSAFLWFERNGKCVKCPILTGGNTAIYDYSTGGPNFGSADLVIGKPKAQVMGGFSGPSLENLSTNAGDLRKGKSSVGSCYDYRKGWPVAGGFSVV